MFAVIATLLAGGSPVASAGAVAAADLPQLFEAACLNGEAKLSPGDAATVSFDALPNDLRQRLGNPASAQIWRLNSAGQAFLYVLGYAPGPTTVPRICGLASDEMNYGAAAETVEKRVTGSVYPKRARTIAWTDPQAGFTAVATTAGKFKVLQVNWLTDEQRTAAMKGYKQVTP